MPYIMDEMGDNKKHVAVGRCKDPTIACSKTMKRPSLSGTFLSNVKSSARALHLSLLELT